MPVDGRWDLTRCLKGSCTDMSTVQDLLFIMSTPVITEFPADKLLA